MHVLLADFCGQTFDFIKDINPEGGKESTGLVTRFTSTTPPDGLTEAFPIRLRLLSETDVARVLANTYYADHDHKDLQCRGPAKEQERLESRAQIPASGWRHERGRGRTALIMLIKNLLRALCRCCKMAFGCGQWSWHPALS